MNPLLAGARAILFDLDGVLTPTVDIHREAWKTALDEAIRTHLGPGQPGFSDEDYAVHVDGKPRQDGVRDFLASRGIELPEGNPGDTPGMGTVWAVGNAKNEAFRRALEAGRLAPYPGSVALLEAAAGRGMRLAVVSSSANAERVLEASGLAGRFEVVVDGLEARRLALPGKPAPDMFLEAARRLDSPPAATAVLEDSVSGIEAGVAGGFSPVIGVARDVPVERLLAAGANAVVADLAELLS